MCAFAVVFRPGARQTRTPMGPLATAPQHVYFGLIWGSEVVFTAERGELNGKVVQWLPRACRVGAVEAVEWVRGRCVGGAASFLVLQMKKIKTS